MEDNMSMVHSRFFVPVVTVALALIIALTVHFDGKRQIEAQAQEAQAAQLRQCESRNEARKQSNRKNAVTEEMLRSIILIEAQTAISAKDPVLRQVAATSVKRHRQIIEQVGEQFDMLDCKTLVED